MTSNRLQALKYSLLVLILFSAIGTAYAADILVGEGTGNITISAALSNATDGDTIIVGDGTYTENIVVNKSVTIQSENGSSNTIVQAASVDAHIFNVTASNVKVSGFNITGATNYTGIYILSASDCNISNNRISENYAGIDLSYSDNNVLINNTVISNEYGIFLYKSVNSTLTDNTMDSNDHNFGVYGLNLTTFIHNIDASNLVNGKSLYYMTDLSDTTIPTDAGQVYLVNSTNITVRDISIANGYDGVTFIDTSNSTITNVTVADCDTGIYLFNSSFNTLDDITIYNNFWESTSIIQVIML